ncbi:MAG TPA: hypothetical protein VFQ63_01350 [Patescibacteria group bacterium]|nr:hypothetical protein [Patescibacteria group bacterium]
MTEQREQSPTVIDTQRRYIAGQLARQCSADMVQINHVTGVMQNLYSLRLDQNGVALPVGKTELARLGVMLYQTLYSGEPLKIVSATCPDYSYHQTQDGYVYDFQDVGDGEGLTGKTLLAHQRLFREALVSAGVPEEKIEYTMLVADVEADDGDIRASMEIEESEFKARIGRTRDKLATHLESPHRVGLLSSYVTSQDTELAHRLLSDIKEQRLVSIALGRGDLYRRWFRRGQGVGVENFTMQRTREDVLKYIAFGCAARRQGAIVLESTAPEITSLYNVGNDLPIVPLVQIKSKY